MVSQRWHNQELTVRLSIVHPKKKEFKVRHRAYVHHRDATLGHNYAIFSPIGG